MINKVSHKSADLTSKLFEYFGGEMNLARIKFFGLFKYHIRIRDNFLVKDPRTGKEIKADVQ
jgi:hypothetical protein